MKLISTGNNFGHTGGMEFNAFLSENVIVLNGRFSVDTASEVYRSAEALEVYLSQLPMERSAVSNAYIRASVTVGQGTRYERTESVGTVVKAWIKGGNTLCIEKFTEYDGNGSFEILLCSMFTTRGYRGEIAKLTKTAVKFTVLSEVPARANDLMCAVADGWCFLHLYFSTSGDLFRQDIRAQLEGFPEDASADVFIVGGGQQTGLKGAYVAEGHIADGILTVTKTSASMGDTGEYPFLFAFIVRDSVNADASGTASMDKDTEEESKENLDNQ